MQTKQPRNLTPGDGVTIKLVFPRGRPPKYHTLFERRQAARVARARHPGQWKRIQATGYQKRNALKQGD
jgi:hypothetical protein